MFAWTHGLPSFQKAPGDRKQPLSRCRGLSGRRVARLCGEWGHDVLKGISLKDLELAGKMSFDAVSFGRSGSRPAGLFLLIQVAVECKSFFG